MQSQISRALNSIEILRDGELGSMLKILTTAALGFVTISILIVAVVNLVRLAHAKERPGEREEIIGQLGTNFISLAIIGGIDVILAILSSLF